MLTFNRSFPHFNRGSDPNFAAGAYGLMSIATKYQADSICKAIVRRLEEEWAQTLSDFVRLKNDFESLCIEGLFDLDKDRRLPEPASAIRLATDFGIPRVLPIAYYILSTYYINSDRRNAHLPRWNLLRRDELFRYYAGKFKLMEEFSWIDRTYDLVDSDDLGCETVITDWDYENGNPDDSSECRKIVKQIRTERSLGLETFSGAYHTCTTADLLGSLAQLLQQPFK